MKKQLGYLPGTEPHYTTRQKIETWFYYYKWYLAAAIVVLISLIPVFRNWLGIGVVNPDYRIACVTAGGISEDTAAELKAAVEAMGEDLNGDGKVVCQIAQYLTGAGDKETQMYFSYASTITIQADIQEGDSHFFLLDAPERFQIGYQVLADADGMLPADEDYSADGRYRSGAELTLPLSEGARQELSRLYLGQRGYYQEIPNLEAYRRMWTMLWENESVCG